MYQILLVELDRVRAAPAPPARNARRPVASLPVGRNGRNRTGDSSARGRRVTTNATSLWMRRRDLHPRRTAYEAGALLLGDAAMASVLRFERRSGGQQPLALPLCYTEILWNAGESNATQSHCE